MTDLRRTRPDARAPGSAPAWSAAAAVLAVVVANLALFFIPAAILLAPTRRAEAEQPTPVPEPTPYVVPSSLAWNSAPVREVKPLAVARRPTCTKPPSAPVKIARRGQRIAEPQSL